MYSLQQALSQVVATPGCSLDPPTGLPVLPQGFQLPDDLKSFYLVAGGATLFRGAGFQFNIVGPSDLVSTNLRLIGSGPFGDISDSWFSVAEDGNGDYLSIDLGPAHRGRCYDSFHETHGVVGNTPIIATSFTDLLVRLLANRGEHPYWLAQGFASLGDAYDGSSEA